MKILLTGASGVIGRELIPFLLGRGHNITAISRNPVVQNNPNFQYLPVDLNLVGFENDSIIYNDNRIRERLNDIFRNVESVLHFSGVASGAGKTWLDYYSGNTKSLETLVKICEKFDIHNFIYASSASVYGRSGVGREAKTSDPLLGETHYAISKIKGEEILLGSGIRKAKILRLASVYGPGFKSFMNKLLNFKKKGFLPFPWKDRNLKSLIYYKDLLEFVDTAIQIDRAGVYNIANPEILEYGEIIKILESVIPGNFWKVPIPEFLYTLEKTGIHVLGLGRDAILKPLFESILMETSETLNTLNYVPRFSLEKGLLDFYK